MNIVLGVALLGVLAACDADTPDLERSDDITIFPLKVLAAVPGGRLRLDVPASRAEEERAYTGRWLRIALRPSAMEQLEGIQFRFMSDLGPRGDDAVVGSARIDGRSVDVVDGRELLFEVQGPLRAESVQSLWWRLFGRGDGPSPRSTDVVVDDLGAVSEGGSHGTIRPAEPPPGWFASPVRWYRLPDRTVFSFEKRILAPAYGRPDLAGRGWIPEGVAPEYIGGIPPSDVRPYLRFEPTNRVSLAKSWARELNGPDEPREGPAYGAPRGASDRSKPK